MMCYKESKKKKEIRKSSQLRLSRALSGKGGKLETQHHEFFFCFIVLFDLISFPPHISKQKQQNQQEIVVAVFF